MSEPVDLAVTEYNAHRAVKAYERRGYEDWETQSIVRGILREIQDRHKQNIDYKQPRTERICRLILAELNRRENRDARRVE